MTPIESLLRLYRDTGVIDIRSRLPILPIRDLIMHPYMMTTLLVGRDRSLAALERAVNDDKLLFLVAQKHPEVLDPQSKDLYRVGCVAAVLQLLRLPDGTAKIMVEGLGRAEVKRYVIRGDLRDAVLARGEPEPPAISPELEAMLRTVKASFGEYVSLHRRLPDDLLASVQDITSPSRLVHVVSAHLLVANETKQALLEEFDLMSHLTLLAHVLAQELDILRLERKIEDEVRGQVQKNQRDFYLNEQLRAIQRELGHEEEGTDELGELEAAIKGASMPAKVKEKAEQELARLKRLPPMTPETGIVRQYLDWLVGLPWEARTEDQLDIGEAERILDEDHYGLTKVKERILEYLAVLKLVKRLKGPILCLVGPPGVGKTSLGKSIARALNRKFVRISLGGVRDEAEIRGHRRTYVGALPGRIIQSIRKAGTRNPVFLLDEVDKMSVDFRGDPSAALLEVLDPEQNDTFSDHYLEVEFDLSEVMFITTANITHAIPPALRDRMEIIRMPGYLRHEKLGIAEQFLIPKLRASHGLNGQQLQFERSALNAIIGRYTREAGVRDLERSLASICRKASRRIAKDPGSGCIVLTPRRVQMFLGAPPYRESELDEQVGVGSATGLAWTEFGGEILTIEAIVTPGKGEVLFTGQLGDVMKESARAGLTYMRSRAEALGLDPKFHLNYDIHVHIPEGAIPKDGPSAGIAMASAMISALTGRPVKRTVAMTGEITLRGRVLPVGGLPEKTVAAQRGGVKEIVLPAENTRELKEIPRQAKRGLVFHQVRSMDEVLALAFVENPLRLSRPTGTEAP
ncbi:endopeptidase La [Candidatus Fermentibacteria bacterium]|nr:endopeptidase La [Candidatus Fermentibacteria bacterium]